MSALDVMLAEENVTRIPGSHCYALYVGEDAIAAMMTMPPCSIFSSASKGENFRYIMI